MKSHPITTLFMLMSVDSKISTGDRDALDVDKDFPHIVGLKEGVSQYYDIEKTTDLTSLNSGRVMAKLGINNRKVDPVKMGCSFVIIDSKPHLNKKGIEYLTKWVKKLYLVTTNKKHPAYEVDGVDNLEIIHYSKKIDLADLFEQLKTKHGVARLTVQSGGTLNAELLRKGLIDKLSVVVAPCLIGGENTASLIDGESLHTQKDLNHIKCLKLKKCDILKHSYLHLQYDIVKETKII